MPELKVRIPMNLKVSRIGKMSEMSELENCQNLKVSEFNHARINRESEVKSVRMRTMPKLKVII